MRRRISCLILLPLAAVLAKPATSCAEPKFATFEQVIERSTTIVIAKFTGDVPDENKRTVKVAVVQALKGKLQAGVQHFQFHDRPRLGEQGQEFIAFLDKDQVWTFIAAPLNPKDKLAESLLCVEGFYDFNAYLITPGLITLDQLKTYLWDGSLVYRFRGEIYFPERGKTEWKPRSLAIAGTYDAVKAKATIQGLPNLKGFPEHPEISIQGRHYEHAFDICYARTSYRPLNLVGSVEGLNNKTGEMLVQFAVSAPELLTQGALEEYLADASLGPCYYTFRLACEPVKDGKVQKTLLLTMGKWTVGRWDSVHLQGYEKTPLSVYKTSYNGPSRSFRSIRAAVPPDKYPKSVDDEHNEQDCVLRMTVRTDSGEFLTLAFQIGEATKEEPTFSWILKNELLYAVYARDIKGTMTLHDGKTARTTATFAATLDSVGFNRKGGKD
jgi:hypothetical protein